MFCGSQLEGLKNSFWKELKMFKSKLILCLFSEIMFLGFLVMCWW